MQTFLPYKNFDETAKVLDWRRLGNQRGEAKAILECLLGRSAKKWQNYPQYRMWKGCEWWLARYGLTICMEWINRGYQDGTAGYFYVLVNDLIQREPPSWLGNEEFHLSHRSNLLRKLPEHYRQFWPHLRDDLDYYWPV